MKKKFVFLIFSIMALGPSILHCTHEIDYCYKLVLCKEMKTLHPTQTEQPEYIKYAQKLFDNNLSACSCMPLLMEEKKKKIEDQCANSGIVNPSFWQALREQNAAMNNRPAEDDVGFSYDSSLPEPLIQFIRGYTTKYPVGAFTVKTTKNQKLFPSFAHANYYDEIVVGMYTKDYNFFTVFDNEEVQKGVLVHELHHIRKKDVKLTEAFWLLIDHYSKFASQYVLAEKFSRFQEAEADRMPAACHDLKIAHYLEKAMHAIMSSNTHKQEVYHQQSTYHPSPKNRLAWATRIRRLRDAEEVVKKQELEQKKRCKLFAYIMESFSL